jgi:hypothetical protein
MATFSLLPRLRRISGELAEAWQAECGHGLQLGKLTEERGREREQMASREGDVRG